MTCPVDGPTHERQVLAGRADDEVERCGGEHVRVRAEGVGGALREDCVGRLRGVLLLSAPQCPQRLRSGSASLRDDVGDDRPSPLDLRPVAGEHGAGRGEEDLHGGPGLPVPRREVVLLAEGVVDVEEVLRPRLPPVGEGPTDGAAPVAGAPPETDELVGERVPDGVRHALRFDLSVRLLLLERGDGVADGRDVHAVGDGCAQRGREELQLVGVPADAVEHGSRFGGVAGAEQVHDGEQRRLLWETDLVALLVEEGGQPAETGVGERPLEQRGAGGGDAVLRGERLLTVGERAGRGGVTRCEPAADDLRGHPRRHPLRRDRDADGDAAGLDAGDGLEDLRRPTVAVRVEGSTQLTPQVGRCGHDDDPPRGGAVSRRGRCCPCALRIQSPVLCC